MRRRARGLTLVLALALLAQPGCLIGSPAAMIAGEPYGMTRDDVSALGGRKGRIWSGAPVFAAVDLPFAAVLDTAFLPITMIVWGLKALAGSDDHDAGHGDEGHQHTEEKREFEARGGAADR